MLCSLQRELACTSLVYIELYVMTKLGSCKSPNAHERDELEEPKRKTGDLVTVLVQANGKRIPS